MLPAPEKTLSGELTAELQQSSRDVALGRFQVWITNGLQEEVRPRRIVYRDALLTGPLEETNEWYAIAKIAGIKLAQAFRKQYGRDYISAMPTNLYGPGDNFDLKTSHVLPALIRKAHEAKLTGAETITVWGTGTPRREFLYVDDLADACVHLMKTYSSEELVNIGTGEDITIAEFARVVAATVGYTGEVSFYASRPDGTPRKLLDVSRLARLGWRASTSLEDGIRLT